MSNEKGKKVVLAYNSFHCENTVISVLNYIKISQEITWYYNLILQEDI